MARPLTRDHQKPCTRFSVGDKKALELHLQKAEGQKQNNRQRIFAAIVKNGVIGAQKMNNITKKQAGDDGKCDAQTNRKQNNECNDLVCLFLSSFSEFSRYDGGCAGSEHSAQTDDNAHQRINDIDCGKCVGVNKTGYEDSVHDSIQ